ncbi:glycosyltransferase family 4 protein [Salinibacter ruber]|uniref:Glycosyltransferase involved in cell wall biosynthesis n=2 Tax=Salinibacter ruber TaxID=146919 RepID=A0A9X2Q7Z1_9BACT|nr:glycosyltransferase family 4 protein [Salinibacter ruber]MCS3711894.1 glycosyltransferase involved in cell wall biosynthesis [Salinibacter ruber]
MPEELSRHCYVEPLVRRVVDALCGPPQAAVWQHRAMAWFDRWCAGQLPEELDAVVCYENAALHTFRAAKGNGITTILDAASFHHQWQDAVYEPVEPPAAHARINAHKDEEIALADHVLTVSELARDSYVKGGVPDHKVTAVPMGADLSDFSPPESRRASSEEPVTFLFVGHAGRRKGTDTLLSATEALANNGVPHRMRFAGDVDEALFADAPPTVERLGYLGRDELMRAMHQADVLVLPSRHDSFGRVVVEAMATGLPALVSANVGAKQVITDGENGWVVPAEDSDALAEQMRWCIEHPEQVTGMQEVAVTAAQDYTWAAYRERVVDVITSVIEEGSSALRSDTSRASP